MLSDQPGDACDDNLVQADYLVAYCHYPYDAEGDDEISLAYGDPVLVLEKDDGYNDGWWRGRNIRKQTGLFPSNFVTLENFGDLIVSDVCDMLGLPSNLVPGENLADSTSTFELDASNEDEQAGSASVYNSSASTCDALQFVNVPMQFWTSEQVLLWLNSRPTLAKFVSIFEEAPTNGETLLKHDLSSLEDTMSILSMDDRTSLLYAIQEQQSRAIRLSLQPSAQQLSELAKIAERTPTHSNLLDDTSSTCGITLKRQGTFGDKNKSLEAEDAEPSATNVHLRQVSNKSLESVLSQFSDVLNFYAQSASSSDTVPYQKPPLLTSAVVEMPPQNQSIAEYRRLSSAIPNNIDTDDESSLDSGSKCDGSNDSQKVAPNRQQSQPSPLGSQKSTFSRTSVRQISSKTVNSMSRLAKQALHMGSRKGSLRNSDDERKNTETDNPQSQVDECVSDKPSVSAPYRHASSTWSVLTTQSTPAGQTAKQSPFSELIHLPSTSGGSLPSTSSKLRSHSPKLSQGFRRRLAANFFGSSARKTDQRLFLQPENPLLDLAHPDLEGLLYFRTDRGKHSTWKRRYCILKGGYLVICKSRTELDDRMYVIRLTPALQVLPFHASKGSRNSDSLDGGAQPKLEPQTQSLTFNFTVFASKFKNAFRVIPPYQSDPLKLNNHRSVARETMAREYYFAADSQWSLMEWVGGLCKQQLVAGRSRRPLPLIPIKSIQLDANLLALTQRKSLQHLQSNSESQHAKELAVLQGLTRPLGQSVYDAAAASDLAKISQDESELPNLMPLSSLADAFDAPCTTDTSLSRSSLKGDGQDQLSSILMPSPMLSLETSSKSAAQVSPSSSPSAVSLTTKPAVNTNKLITLLPDSSYEFCKQTC